MLDAFIIEQIRREKEKEEWLHIVPQREIPVFPENRDKEPGKKPEEDRKAPVVIEF